MLLDRAWGGRGAVLTGRGLEFFLGILRSDTREGFWGGYSGIPEDIVHVLLEGSGDSGGDTGLGW